MRLILMGLFAVLAVSAVASPSASALQWYVNGVLLPGVLEVEGEQLGNGILKAKIAGVAAEVVCRESSGSGTIDNGGSPALGLGLGVVDFKQCTAPKPAGCSILNGLLVSTAKLDLGTIGGESYALLLPDPSGSVFTLIPVRGCSEEANYIVEGELVGLVNNARRTVEFTKGAPNNKLKLGGKEAELEADVFVLMKGGGAFEVK